MTQQPPYGQPPNQPPSQPPGNQPPWQGQPPQSPPYDVPPGQQPYAPQYPPPQQKRRGFFGRGCLIAFGIAAIVLIGAIVLISSLANSVSKAVNATATPFVAANLAQLNQTVSVPNWDVTATGVEKPGKTLTWSQFKNTSVAAGTWVIVAVDMKNTGTKNFGINGPDFQLKDSAGNTYNVSTDGGASSYSEFKGGQRIGGQVPPGTTVRYYIPFDVSPTATGLTLQFEQGNKPLINLGQNAS